MKTSHIGLVLLLVIALVAGSAEAAKPKQKQKSRAEVKREAIAEYRQVQEQATKFLVPEFYVDGQSQIRNIAFTRRGSDIEVVWSEVSNRMYEILSCSTEQRFSPGSGNTNRDDARQFFHRLGCFEAAARALLLPSYRTLGGTVSLPSQTRRAIQCG